MTNMINMEINDETLENVTGGVSRSVNNYSIRHAVVRNRVGFNDNVSRSNSLIIRKQPARSIRRPIITGPRWVITLL